MSNIPPTPFSGGPQGRSSSSPQIARLRADAAAFDPAPPAALRRRILSALAALPDTAPAAPWSITRWSLATAAIASVVIATILVLQGRPGPHQHGPNQIAVHANPTPNVLASANPLALAHRYIDQPLESEFQNLLTDLSRTGNTVARVLPSPTRRARPTTQLPAGA